MLDIGEYSLFERVAMANAALIFSIVASHPAILHMSGVRPIAGWWHGHLHRLATKLNRANRSIAKRIYRGMIWLNYALIVASSIAALIILLNHLSPYALYLEMIVIAALLPVGTLIAQCRDFSNFTHDNDINAARDYMAGFVRYDVSHVDAHALHRLMITHIFTRLTQSVCTPVIAFICGGLIAFMVILCLNLLMHIAGHNSHQHTPFGWSARMLHRLAHAIPARLMMIIIALAALFVPKASLRYGLLIPLRSASEFVHSADGWPIAASAGALGITLGGPVRVDNEQINLPWVGRGTAKIGGDDVRRARLLYIVSYIIILLCYISALFFFV